MSCVRTGREGNISLVKCVLYHHGTCLRNLLGRTLACWKPWKDRIWAFLFHQENTSKTEHRHTCTENKTRTYDKEIFSFLSVAHVDQFLLNQETVITLQSILITGFFNELRWMTIISARMISGDFFYFQNTLMWWGGCLWSQEARGKGWERLRVPCVVVNQLITISSFLTHQHY